MPSVTLHTSSREHQGHRKAANLLPDLLQTPSGLAILEIQGTIHAPFPDHANGGDGKNNDTTIENTHIGRLEFPLYDSKVADESWMKKVYLYVGKHQRLTGQVKKLPKPLAVIGKRSTPLDNRKGLDVEMDQDVQPSEELEILEIVKYKILFGSRPEPVGEWTKGPRT